MAEEIFNGSFICPVLYDEYVIPLFLEIQTRGFRQQPID